MKFSIKTILSFALIVNTNILAEIRDLSVLNIDSIGYQKLNKIKTDDNIDWWIEMGDKMLIASKINTAFEKPEFISIESKLKNIDTNELAFQTLGHCDHSLLDEKLHEELDVIFANHSSQIINIKQFANQKQLYGHDSIQPFKRNTVLSYQIKNRDFTAKHIKGDQIQSVLNQVDESRWYSQVEYLSGLDRMLEADLIIAGEWLENKFNNLGLSTSRVIVHPNYRGFNVLGFKLGTLKPDEWYIVGAHLDSRNRFWENNSPSPGAEDNASGCSGVLETANVISQYETEASIVFMCFIEEESGLLGSKDVITYLSNQGDIDKVKTMLNMDMISYRLDDRNVAIAGTNTSLFQNLANTLAANGNLYTNIDWQVSLSMCCTDFLSFSNAGIAAVTSNQPDIQSYFGYHSVNDLAENLDPELGSGIIKANLATLIDLVGVDFNSNDLIFLNSFD